jgi:hypothetical protein
LRPAPESPEFTADLSRQILVTARQPNTFALGLVGDPSTLYLRRPGYGPAAGVDRLLDQIAREHGLERVDGWQISSLGVYCEVYRLARGQDRYQILARLRADDRVESAQPMLVYDTEGMHYNDPYAEMQPALAALSLDVVHEFATGRGVTVAVIDSMVDDDHPEIRGRVPVRRDLVRGRRPGGRAEIHGTAIAGVIASMANNAVGIVGVAPDAEIESLRACWTVDATSGRAMCSSFSLAQALEVALRSGVKVINMSLSGPRDPLIERLIEAAIRQEVIVVAALPDHDESEAGFPASLPGVIAVASGNGRKSMVQALSAPGTEILSTAPNSGYAFFSGNSMSSAFAAGVVALLLEHRPSLTGEEVFGLLAETSNADSINACQALARLAITRECQSSPNAQSNRRPGD